MIDYKKQYLKYKFKYLTAKSNKNLTGGGIELTSFTGLSIAALIAGVIYYLYINNINKSTNCLNELEDRINNTSTLEKKNKLEELKITHEYAINNYNFTCDNKNNIHTYIENSYLDSESTPKKDHEGKTIGLFPPNPYNPLHNKNKSLKDFM